MSNEAEAKDLHPEVVRTPQMKQSGNPPNPELTRAAIGGLVDAQLGSVLPSGSFDDLRDRAASVHDAGVQLGAGFRITTVNVTGDLTACAIMNCWLRTKESEPGADGDEVSRPVGAIL